MSKTVNVPADIRAKVEAEVLRCIDVAIAHYGIWFEPPTIDYDLRGKTSGRAYCKTNHITLNSILLVENGDFFIDGRTGRGTVTHEVAHIVDYIVNDGFGKRGTKWDIHGESWKNVMRLLGVKKPTRCHSYDVTNARTKRPYKKSKYLYECDTCGERMILGPVRHRRMQRGTSRYWMNTCKKHSGYSFIMQLSKPPQRPAPKKTKSYAPKPPKAGTKLDYALQIVKENTHLDRGFVITKIMQGCGMSYAGAQTYYYKAKKIAA